jgi:metal-responsive CopG/Arc/MetJ family transcriptional regulator
MMPGKKRRRGRPKVMTDPVQITVDLPGDVLRRLDRLAEARETSRSALIRRICILHLAMNSS